MLRIISLPKIENNCSRKNIDANRFIKEKRWIINILRNQYKLSTYPEQYEIINSCRVKLWMLYLSNPNQSDGFYFISIKNYLLSLFNNMKLQNNSAGTYIPIEFAENIKVENKINHLDEKIFIEKIESNASNKTHSFILNCFLLKTQHGKKRSNKTKSDKWKKRYIRKTLSKQFGYTIKDFRIIEEEVRQIINNRKKNYNNSDNLISNLIAEEI